MLPKDISHDFYSPPPSSSIFILHAAHGIDIVRWYRTWGNEFKVRRQNWGNCTFLHINRISIKNQPCDLRLMPRMKNKIKLFSFPSIHPPICQLHTISIDWMNSLPIYYISLLREVFEKWDGISRNINFIPCTLMGLSK
jgi:hypothetical protein